jgi:TPR repeat protein
VAAQIVSSESVKRVVSKDLDEASREVAPESHSEALFDIGEKYFHGDGLPQDYKATDLAVERREYVASLMNPAQIAELQRRAGAFKAKDIIPAKPAARNVLCCA